MASEYDPVQLVKDAARFARTDFGKHYIEKLERRVEECKSGAVDLRLSREERADWGLIASEAQRQLDYFTAAHKTASDPNLLKRLADGFKKRMRKEADGKE